MYFFRVVLCLMLLFLLVSSSSAQVPEPNPTHPTRIYGTLDSEIAMPGDTDALGRTDATAATEISATRFRKVL
ncbi:hypothetical protein HDF17_003634 [Granulicella arctica]|uniref:Uncharacterized protein n=1 Tax=Granulicella arctica TaxID=940613 RepID=A0A7Y9PKB6_9BACT|nr:hypothetical protein [Granulicella arctica]